MTEQRMLRAFSELDAPVTPDAAFADRLYETLTAELGLKRPSRAAAGPVVVLSGPVARTRAPHRRRSMMLTLLAAAFLLLAMLAGGLLIAGWHPEPPTPLETMERSRAAYAQAPAVRFVLDGDMGAAIVEGDGHGTWRSQSSDQSPGSFVLYDGQRTGWYDATTRSWVTRSVQDGGPPLPFNTYFTWTNLTYPNLIATMEPVACQDAVAAPALSIAGRDAEGIACPTIKTTYWLDTETHLVLRAEAAFGSPYWNGALVDPASGDVQDERPTVAEVTSFEVLDPVDPADFDWAGPRTTSRTGLIPGTLLVIGEPPPAWTGSDLDGSPITLPTAGTPTAVLVWSIGCDSCRDAERAFDRAAQQALSVRAVSISLDARGTLAGYRGMHPARQAQVADPDGSVTSAWGFASIPTLILLDARGRVVDLASARQEDTDVLATLATLATGTPRVVPEPASSAEGLATPVTPGRTCQVETHVACVDVGERLPAWSGRTSAGEQVSSRTAAGRPLVLWLESPGLCRGPCPDWAGDVARGMGDLSRAYDGRARVLLIAQGETEPGDTQAVLDQAGARVDVVYDWDGAIGRTIGQQTTGAIVLDADGRVVAQWTGLVKPAYVRGVLAGLVASPAP